MSFLSNLSAYAVDINGCPETTNFLAYVQIQNANLHIGTNHEETKSEELDYGSKERMGKDYERG